MMRDAQKKDARDVVRVRLEFFVCHDAIEDERWIW